MHCQRNCFFLVDPLAAWVAYCVYLISVTSVWLKKYSEIKTMIMLSTLVFSFVKIECIQWIPQSRGLEAPRNSFELQAETCQRNGAAGDVPVEEDWQEEGCYPVEASMKKLINDELSKHCNTRPNGPSIVARLMGMDMLPVDTKPVVQLNDNKNESKGVKLSKKGKSRRGSVGLDLSKPDSSKLNEFDSFYDHVERDADCRSSLKKPMPREHPQEEELQMFKKEFLAWQAARFKEYAKVADISEQFIAQETLNMRKMELYSMSQRTTNEKPIEIEGLARNKPQYSGGLQNNKNKSCGGN